MQVLVTGHDGYIGAVLVPLLLDRGHDVLGLDSGLFRSGRVATDPRAKSIELDIRDTTPAHFSGCDVVINLAALSNDPLGTLDPTITDEINHRAAIHIADAARAAGVRRFIQMSTCSLYGAAGDDWVDERMPLQPITAYGRSKAAAEHGISQLACDSFSPVFLRCATAYGWSPKLRSDIVVNNLAGWAVTTGEARLLSDGSAWRPLIHVADIARVAIAMLEAPRDLIHNRAFNIGRNEDNFRIRDIAAIIVAEIPEARVALAEGAPADKRSYRVDFSRFAHTFPDFDMSCSLPESVRLLASIIRERYPRAEQYFGPDHTRVDHIRSLLASGKLRSDYRLINAIPVPA